MFTDIHNCCMLLGTADDILILCHKSPDGDTIGAAYGLYHALTQLGPPGSGAVFRSAAGEVRLYPWRH